MQINLQNIKASPKPLRTTWDEDKLNELAKSIQSQGLIVPIKVRPSNGKYEIVYGHRRVEAARRAGWNAIDCLVEEMDMLTSHQQELTENVIREDMTAIDISKALRAEIAETGQTQEEIGKKYGWKRQTVTGYLSLTSDPRITKIAERLPQGITNQHWVMANWGSNSKEDAIAVFEKASKEELSTRQTHAVAESIAATTDPNRRKALLETPYSSMLHDPEYNRERSEKYGSSDPYSIPNKKSPGEKWAASIEVRSALNYIQANYKITEEINRMDELGKFSPEARSFIARKAAQMVEAWQKVISKLEAPK